MTFVKLYAFLRTLTSNGIENKIHIEFPTIDYNFRIKLHCEDNRCALCYNRNALYASFVQPSHLVRNLLNNNNTYWR